MPGGPQLGMGEVSMVNQQLVEGRLQALESYVDALRDLQKYDLQTLRTRLEHRWSVERGLEISAECVLDIGGHIVASDKLGRPGDYTEVLDLLGANGVLPEEFAREIRGLAGFRNLLAHEYLRVDVERLYEFLRKAPTQFEDFMGHVRRYMKTTA